jgi:hypothetical protein
LVLQLVLLGNPCDGQFHWGKNYRLEANTLANLLLGNEDSADENIKEEGQEPAIVKVDSSSNDPLDPIRSFLLTRNLRALENSPLSQTLMKSPRLFKSKHLKKSTEKDQLFNQMLSKTRLLKKSGQKDRLFNQILLRPRLLKKSVENDLMYQSYMPLCRYSGTCRFFH